MAKISSQETFKMAISVGKNILQTEHWKDQETKRQENRVYLKNGQEFQIFLKNYRGIPVMVELTINGETEKETIILDPGERLFLERYLSTNNKFKFNTYKISNNVKKLIENNVKELGVITARVYSLQSVYSDTPVTSTTIPKVQYIVDYFRQPVFNGYRSFQTFNNEQFMGTRSNISGYVSSSYTSCNNMASSLNNNEFQTYTSYCVNEDVESEKNSQNLAKEKLQEVNTQTEFGAIERGNYSDQKFEGCPDFKKGMFLESYTIHIYPISAQSSEEKSNRIEGAIYCSVCGRKQKHGQKYCPADGTKFGE